MPDQSLPGFGGDAHDAFDQSHIDQHLEPGINYTLSYCKGRWAYMNDEGSSYIQKGYRIGCERFLACQYIIHIISAFESGSTAIACTCFFAAHFPVGASDLVVICSKCQSVS